MQFFYVGVMKVTCNKQNKKSKEYIYEQVYFNLHFSQSQHIHIYFKMLGSIICAQKDKRRKLTNDPIILCTSVRKKKTPHMPNDCKSIHTGRTYRKNNETTQKNGTDNLANNYTA